MSSKRIYRLQRQGNLLFCRAAVGGSEGNPLFVKLLVDTGSNATVIPTWMLQRLGCNLRSPLKRTTIVAASGVVTVPVVAVPWFNCLGVRKEDFPVVALNLPVSAYQLGLLGMDFLREIKAVIDVAEGQIQLR